MVAVELGGKGWYSREVGGGQTEPVSFDYKTFAFYSERNEQA